MKIKDRIEKKGFPTNNSRYATAHEEASKDEKHRYPKGYEKLKHLDEKLPKGELIGKNTKGGKIEVSKKVPSELRKEVAFHERDENRRIREKPIKK